MGFYEGYFREEWKEKPYESDKEAMDDIRALVDICLNVAFSQRELEGERLDMRGVVITPQEFYQALGDWTLEARLLKETFRNRMASEIRFVKGYLESRVTQSKNAGKLPGIYRIIQILELNHLESLCFFLAAVCDYDRKYERLYGYIQDNVGARMPTIGLGISLYAGMRPEEEAAPEGDLDWVHYDSPLWIYLLRQEECDESQSRLSKPMILREAVLGFLRGESWFVPAYSGFIHLEQEKNRLKVSLKGLVEYASAGSAPGMAYSSESPETILANLVLASKIEGLTMELSCESGQENKEKMKRLLACLPVLGLMGRYEEGLGLDASKVHLVYQWEDLILEESQKDLLQQICDQIWYREMVMKQWGFEKKLPYGSGISAVFYGAPGTGKTMAAQVMGKVLGRQVYKVDVSRLVSKYIGETEKNIGELFDRAREQNVILFFDEADGLFAKRSNISNSNDRYANMETGYLLQRFEEYEGIAILATNFINNIDEAFKRRIRFFVRFTFPDQEMRLKLWQSMIPEDTPLNEPLKFRQFAERYELAGSAIKEIVTNAAYLAAARHRGIANEDIGQALKLYYMKLGKKISDHELYG